MVLISRRTVTSVLLAGVMSVGTYAAQTTPPPTQTPVPKPFPTSGSPPGTAAKPPTPTPVVGAPAGSAAITVNWGTISPLLTSVPAYAGAEFLESLDAGRNQRVFVFGTNDPYGSVVAFYKTQLKKAGDEVSKRPAIQQFDIAPFDSNTMDHRPSVIVKDFTWPDPAGYVHVDGTTEKLFKTLIQVIPSGR